MERLKKYLKRYSNAKILDIGTGRGDFIALIDYLYQDYQEIIGIDIVDYLLQMNQKTFKDNPKIKFVEDDILKTNLADNSFDIVCLSNTLHHLPDIEATLKQMKKVVKPEGIVIINEMISDKLNAKQISHKLLHHFAAKIDRELGRVHQETYTEEQIIEILKSNKDLNLLDYWQMKYDLPSESDDLDGFYKIIDRLLCQVNESESYNEYVKEAEELKTYLQNNGFASATQLVLILNK
jgi:ubiquinone/menaquinone biosynthesis C-methylase UbiE